MKPIVVAALTIAIGLILSAFVGNGRYYLMRVNGVSVVRLDRITGDIKLYRLQAGGGIAEDKDSQVTDPAILRELNAPDQNSSSKP